MMRRRARLDNLDFIIRIYVLFELFHNIVDLVRKAPDRQRIPAAAARKRAANAHRHDRAQSDRYQFFHNVASTSFIFPFSG